MNGFINFNIQFIVKIFRTSVVLFNLISFTLIIIGCHNIFDPVQVEVGPNKILKSDIETADFLESLKYPWEKNKLGKNMLIRAFTYAEIMKKYNRPVTNAILETEYNRIETNTRDRASLEKMKAIFHGNKEKMLKVLVLPVYVERTLPFDLFAYNSTIHASEKAKANEFMTRIKETPKLWDNLVKHYKMSEMWVCIDTKEGISYPSIVVKGDPCSTANNPMNKKGSNVTDQSANAAQAAYWKHELAKEDIVRQKQESVRWLKEIVTPLKTNEISSQIIEQDNGYMIVRLEKDNRSNKKELTRAQLKAAVLNKSTFSEWVDKEKLNVAVKEL